jgi:hypothetical protein
MVWPETAAKWLARNKQNRPLGRHTVDRYKRAIRLGEWKVNGEAVIIDDADNLLDGQHRLQAIVESETPIPMLVVYGVPADAFPTLNSGKTRSLADVLMIRQEAHQRTVAGVLRILHRATLDRLGVRTVSGDKPSNTELLTLLDKHPGVREAVDFIVPLCKKGLHPPALMAFLYYQMSASRPEVAEEFFTAFLTQTGIRPNSIESRLNDWIVNNAKDCRTQEGAIYYLAIVIKAWHHRVVGGRVPQHLSWRAKGGEPFPKII